MPFFDAYKIAIGAGLVGVLGAGVIGYVAGRKRANNMASMLNTRINMAKQADLEGNVNPIIQYVMDNSLREPDVLRRHREETIALNKLLVMLGNPEEAQLFRLLLKQMNAKKVIEVGVYTGFNTLSFAMTIPDDGRVVACDITDEYVNAFGKKLFKEAGVEHKIDLRIQAADKTLDELISNGEAGTFDFVFIDADKPGYDSYYEKSLILVRKGGIIAIDNVLWFGRIVQDPADMDEKTTAIHTLNQKIHRDNRVDIAMLPFADGVTLALKL